MKNWKPLSSIGGIFGIGLTVFLAIAGLILLAVTVILCFAPDSAGVNLTTFGLGLLALLVLAVAGWFGYRTSTYFRLRYNLDRNAITVNLGNRTQIIPLANIRHVLPANKVLELLRTPDKGDNNSDGVRERVYARPRQTTTQSSPTSAADASAADSFFIEGDVVYEASVVERDFSTADMNIAEAQVVEIEPDDLKGGADAGTNGRVDGANWAKTNAAPQNAQIRNLNPKTKPFSSWRGFYDNRGWLDGVGEVQFYSTVSFEQTLLVRTDTNTYAISPRDPQSFMTEYKLRRNLGATEEVVEGVSPGVLLSHPLWRDKLGRGLLLGGLLVSLALFVYLILIFETLDPILRIHYNKFGEVDRLGARGDIMWLPFIGIVTFGVNALFGAFVHIKDRVAAILLYSATFAVQFAVWVAVFGIII
jgi:Bacterial PH domain